MSGKKIIVVGGGPSGMMAAIRASQLHANVTLVEKNPILGKKLLLSGKGRCNLTNACDLVSFLKRFSKNGQFLRDAFKKFFNQELMKFFEKRGLPGCTAGLNWIQVTPDGMIKRCSDHPVVGHFTEWRKGFFKPTTCDRCWYSCRGAAQEPWTMKRFVEMAREALG